MGRKASKDPRSAAYRLRMTEQEKEELDSICRAIGIRKSAYIRRALVLMKEQGLSPYMAQILNDKEKEQIHARESS